MESRHSAIAQTGVKIDEGLRKYMLRVYNLMALGVGSYRRCCLLCGEPSRPFICYCARTAHSGFYSLRFWG